MPSSSWAKANAAEIRATMHATPNGHPWTVGPRSALEVSAEEREAAYASRLGEGRPGAARHLPRHPDRPRRQRHRRRLHQRPHPRGGEGPRHGGDAGRYRPPLRHQAPADRHRLFRDLQPRQRRAGRHPRRPDRARHADRHPAAQRGGASARRHRLRHRLRRHDRRAAADGHHGARRPAAAPRPGRPGRAPISACRCRASRTCSPSPARAAPRC